ncbi:Ribokinase-like protein [Aureobasidium pullulans EXF-150]|uniref:Adenosine kinase n=1 Tax=Aureobasidium pullulans EXF-150 TaxID=1043002 RepID=A0A074XUU8_AURPU|nr:Ribokinase-like protein [Aureobasidium pullulans EXF-150]KEQ78401.1 Ribokinase-like protein [Aureobasidium pullulans EXF-150]
MARLLCLENPLLDIQAFGNHTLLKKYGLKPNDAILADQRHHNIYEDLIDNHAVVMTAGGGAQNTARAAAYMLASGSVLYLGCVGRDSYADILRSACHQAGVDAEYLVDDSQPTGRCAVIVTDDNRTCCTDLGAANCYKLKHLEQPRIWNLVTAARFYYVGAYHLTVCPEAVMALANEAATNNKVFMMSLSAPFIPHVFKATLDMTEPYWDVLVGNESEAIAWAESHDFQSKDVGEIARHLAARPKVNKKRPRIVLITQGPSPTIIAESGILEDRCIPVKSIERSEIVDTTGAGDAFAGGFLAGLVEGKPLETCVDMGHWLARLSIKELGPRFPNPKQKYSF